MEHHLTTYITHDTLILSLIHISSEGPEVIYRDGYYYLFLAYDALDVPYNTRVVR